MEPKLTHISQIGLCVKDLDAAVQGMEKVFGVKPSRYGETPETRRY